MSITIGIHLAHERRDVGVLVAHLVHSIRQLLNADGASLVCVNLVERRTQLGNIRRRQGAADVSAGGGGGGGGGGAVCEPQPMTRVGASPGSAAHTLLTLQ